MKKKISLIIILFFSVSVCNIGLLSADHTIPDKCSHARKEAHRVCYAALVACGLATSCLVVALLPGLPALCAVASIPCAASTPMCAGGISDFNSCCRGLRDDKTSGFTKSMFQVAALCSSCTFKNSIIRDVCAK